MKTRTAGKYANSPKCSDPSLRYYKKKFQISFVFFAGWIKRSERITKTQTFSTVIKIVKLDNIFEKKTTEKKINETIPKQKSKFFETCFSKIFLNLRKISVKIPKTKK